MADPTEEQDPQTEQTTDEQPLGSGDAPGTTEAPPRDPVVERIHELTGEIGTLRSVAGAQQPSSNASASRRGRSRSGQSSTSSTPSSAT
jgi:hypothetical protein